MKGNWTIRFLAAVLLRFVVSGYRRTSLPTERLEALGPQSAWKAVSQVTSDGRVAHQLSAPQAQKVELDIGGVRYPLTKGENGVWTGGESKPQDEGFH